MKNKLLISFILFILLIFSFFSISFSGYVDTSDGSVIYVPDFSNLLSEDKPDYVVFKSGKTGNIVLYTFLKLEDQDKFYFSPGYFVFYPYNYTDNYTLIDNEWVLQKHNDTWSNTGVSVTVNVISDLYYSSCDVYDSQNHDVLVFPLAPSQGVTISAIQQVEEIPQVMEQVMKILIPVGLIVFSIGLVIYLTRLVISRLT